jgi:Zn-dependent alcohol dehydrogenase
MKEIKFRDPVADEVRIRLEGCGVSASNIPVWQGKP